MNEPVQTTQHTPWDWSWFYWFLVPIYPYGQRRTLRTEVVKDTIWTFDQVQGIFYVVVPVRMTVVRLESGGLLVYAPVAPTPECIRLVKELVNQYGDVKYIIHPTVSGLEHKVFVGPFARWFPHAQVFVVPQQWSFPINLPLSWLGFPLRRTQVLPQDSRQVPFAEEFDYEILGPLGLGLGKFGEVAMLHRRSHTLLLTDTLVSVPEEPPAIVQADPYPLLYHAKDTVADVIEDTPANRRKGWQRIVLFAFYFKPSTLDVEELGPSLQELNQAPDRSRKALFGWFPFRWKETWSQTFQTLRAGGRPFVAPILQQLILNRNPKETLAWADRVARWDFRQIIPCHLAAPIQADGRQFRQAFEFLEKHAVGLGNSLLPEADMQVLKEIDQGLTRRKITPPAQERV
ncbi:MAG TPA: DUF4336 domain-containing protein [Synechococcales cyanobacterium M55_K2018_004]|nr:DUF4336 domain-containing protein [Synechococcales cyanobacterium M55_K2018_004]